MSERPVGVTVVSVLWVAFVMFLAFSLLSLVAFNLNLGLIVAAIIVLGPIAFGLISFFLIFKSNSTGL